jgi:mycothiol synthase
MQAKQAIWFLSGSVGIDTLVRMSARIRGYEEHDAAAVAGFLASAASLDATIVASSEEEWRAFVGRSYVRGARDFAVAESGGEIVAALMSTREERDGTAFRNFRIIVHPQHRRAGIATRLMALAEEQDADRDTTLESTVAGKWRVASAWLERLGFHVVEHVMWMGVDEVPDRVPVPEGIVLRPYRADAEDDRAWVRLNREGYEGSTDFTDLTAGDRAGLRGEPAFHLWFAEREAGDIVGLCHTKEFGGKGTVNSLVVSSAYRGRGLGRALLLAGMHTLNERKPGRIRLNVRAENTHAVALYRSVGFELEDDFHTWWKPRSPAP